MYREDEEVQRGMLESRERECKNGERPCKST